MKPLIADQESREQRLFLTVLVAMALFKLLIHLCTNAFASYGIFRDEFYYLACSHRLDLGYVDQPPLSIYFLSLSRLVFGESLFALRLLPAMAGAITVIMTGLIVRKLGGRLWAMIIACLAVIAAPIFLGMNTIYSMNSFDILFWTLAAYILIIFIMEERTELWILLGLVIGLGLLNKIGMVWFAVGLFVALVLTRQRKHFSTKWPYLMGLIAIIVFLPYIIWNIRHDFAHLEFIRNSTTGKYSGLTPMDFILGQLLILQPVTLPIWLAGLYYYFFGKEGKTFRPIGIIYVVAFFILVINIHSKPEYLAPAYPMLFAAGGVQMERWTLKKYFAWLKYALPTVLVIGGIITAPLVLPCLSVESYIQYSERIGFTPGTYEGKELAELPQFYADRFGWENMAKTVSEVYTSLSQEEKSKTVVFVRNYGEAGAIEYYSRMYALPPVIASHNNYWLWGWEHREKDYQTILDIGGNITHHTAVFEEVQQAAVIRCHYCMPYENNLPVFIGRKPKVPFEVLWKMAKHYE